MSKCSSCGELSKAIFECSRCGKKICVKCYYKKFKLCADCVTVKYTYYYQDKILAYAT